MTCDDNPYICTQARLGDVGGNSLGYIGGCWSVCGEKLASQSFDGALQLWSHSDSDGQSFWRPSTTFGGHVLQVKDIAWQPVDGNFLLSASLDQTVRLYGQWDHNGESTWYELARPQIHGYNMQCVSMLNKHIMISAGEEKIIRVFGATKNFIDNFQNLTGKTLMDEQDKEKLPTGASIPALGLSNKACSDTDTGGDCGSGTNNYVEQCFQSLNLSEPATTSDLSQNTLWPEKEKLYGHGYDVYSIAVHPDTNTVASACKATNTKHAAVILWDAETWRIRQHVEGHSLTVTGIAFSRRDGRYMLTVSRDRTWNVYRQNADQTYELLIQTDKRTSGHTRIIWSCCWSHDDLYFCTVSRDKKAIVWKTPSQNTSAIPESYSLTLNSSITAVDFAPTLLGNNSYLISLGDESGYIHLYSFSEDSSFTHLHTMDNCFAHQDTVTKLAFRPSKESASHTTTLASCSADSSVKFYDINMNSLQ